MTGNVVPFDKGKGSGFIKGDNVEMPATYTGHSDIVDFAILYEGQQVKFIPVQGTPEKSVLPQT